MALKLDKERSALLIVDVQDKLCAVMGESRVANLTRNICVLLEAARRMSIPVVVTQQYPRGLGGTVQAITELLAAQPQPLLHRFDKVEFSVCAADAFASVYQAVGRTQWIVVGMESHVCVFQSVRDLRQRSVDVSVVADAVLSRTDENLRVGLSLAKAAGAVVTSTEAVVFDLLERAGSDDFKALSRLIR